MNVNTYPADEQNIYAVERGNRSHAILPLSADKPLAPGDSILFALGYVLPHKEPFFVKGGDSVRVLLTGVIDLGETDPATGQGLFRLSWEPLGRPAPPTPTKRRATARS